MEHVWDASADSFSGAIRVHMSSLRRKLKAVLGYDPILNRVGEGYKIREEAEGMRKMSLQWRTYDHHHIVYCNHMRMSYIVCLQEWCLLYRFAAGCGGCAKR